MIKPQMFSRRIEPIGQYVRAFTAKDQSVNWVVPDGVYEISAVVVNAGQEAGFGTQPTQIKRGATILLSATMAMTGDVGGGNGGPSGTGAGPRGGGAGGGAGGYTGNGGPGANWVNDGLGYPIAASGSNGNGGGGGGGGVAGGSSGGAYGGGGVGLLGTGTNGAGGSPGNNGGHGSQRAGSGAYGAPQSGVPGGNLRWRNGIAVTPGETLTLIGTGFYRYGGQGALRIMWGGGRSYPSNALDM